MDLRYIIDVFEIITPVKLIKNSERNVYGIAFINIYKFFFLIYTEIYRFY